jgi:hypothetical protein
MRFDKTYECLYRTLPFEQVRIIHLNVEALTPRDEIGSVNESAQRVHKEETHIDRVCIYRGEFLQVNERTVLSINTPSN